MTQSPAPLIAEGVTKSYGKQRVVDQATLQIQPGNVTALVGQSGAGKTTLLRLLAGMEKPDAGTIRSGTTVLSDAHTFTLPEQRRIGLVFQDFALFPHLDVVRNITFGLSHLPREDRLGIADHWLETLGLTKRAKAFPHQLSGGEQQRVAIARALAPKPVAILMDEPFSGLDPVLRDQACTVALDAIRASGTPALVVTHEAREAMAYADQIAVMHAGTILQVGSPEEVYTAPTNQIVARALGRLQSVGRAQLPETWQQTLPEGPVLYIRPEAIRLDVASPVAMEVSQVRRQGALTLVSLKYDTLQLQTAIISSFAPKPGEHVSVTIDPNCVHTFAT